jgi:hypothetical protein
VTGRRGRICRKLLDDLKEGRGYSQLKEEALDRTMWRDRFGRGFPPVVRQTAKGINKLMNESIMKLGFINRCGGLHWNIRTKIKLLKTSSTSFHVNPFIGITESRQTQRRQNN